MTLLTDIVRFCDETLRPADFSDYCPNGLQVEGRREVRLIVSGVTACQDLLDAAVAHGADLVLVHHGYFWRNEAAPLVGIKGRRVRTLMQSDISLLAYHLPLDAHPDLGNNRQLGERLGFVGGAPFDGLVWGAELPQPLSAGELVGRIAGGLGRPPTVLGRREAVRRIAWCTGAAQGYIGLAAAAGYDAYISGEVSEQTRHEAEEHGVLYLGAGHHATERYGVQALGGAIAAAFPVEHLFVDIDNPV
jgi:dinuclear metal center YbgI/SA1388 family protein